MALSTIGTNQLGTGSDTDAIDLPSGTTAQRPSSPAEGMTRYNTDLDKMEVYVNDAWQTVTSAEPPYTARALVIAGGGAG